MNRIKNLAIFCMLLACSVQAQLTDPETFLGFTPGADRRLATRAEITEYFCVLDLCSDRIVLEETGQTTLGYPFITAFITSPSNHAELEQLRQLQERLADPRTFGDEEAQALIARGKTVVMINCSIHATEIGASQMSMKLAYDLACSSDPAVLDILENVVLLLHPMQNPDGIQLVVDWYKKYAGTPFEGGPMPWLYQKYTGHDNNRDWYMFTQIESRLVLELYNAWHPHIVLDMHQMGTRGARLFVPPYVDPYEPNVDPVLRQQVAALGTFIASELTAQGKTGVQHSSGFDAWTPARAYPHYHGGVRILTEAASVRVATPVTIPFDDLSPSVREPSVSMPMPWKGGTWRLGDIVEYDYAAAFAVLRHAARLRESWLRNSYLVYKKAVMRTGPPYAFIIPRDQRDLPATLKMLEVLRMGDVEIRQAETEFQAGGMDFHRGDFIIHTAQPCGAYAMALLGIQEYPELRDTPDGPLRTPYDAVAHTLPLLMGVKILQVNIPIEIPGKRLESVPGPAGKVNASENVFGYAWTSFSNEAFIALNRLLQKGYRVFRAAESFESRGKKYSPGTLVVRSKSGLDRTLQEITQDLSVDFGGVDAPSIPVYQLRRPIIRLYQSWTASVDEGWTRWVLEQHEFPCSTIQNEELRRGDIKADVLILPDMDEKAIINGVPERLMPEPYAGGIGMDGVEEIRHFVESGGCLITLDRAASFAINRFYLDIEDIPENTDRNRFFIPGSILRVNVKNNHPVAYGYEEEAAIFFRNSPLFKPKTGTGVLVYPHENVLLSGWITGEPYIHGKSALVDVPFGKGKIILIGFPALYRGQSHATFRFLFNAIYYGTAELKSSF